MYVHVSGEGESEQMCVCVCLSTTDNPANESSASVTLCGALLAGSLDSSVDRETERERRKESGVLCCEHSCGEVQRCSC